MKQTNDQKKKKQEERILKLWHNIKQCDICVTVFSEEEEQDGAEVIFENIMAENFQKLMINNKLQLKEAQRTPNRTQKHKQKDAYNIRITENERQRENLEVNQEKEMAHCLQWDKDKIIARFIINYSSKNNSVIIRMWKKSTNPELATSKRKR